MTCRILLWSISTVSELPVGGEGGKADITLIYD